MRGKLDAAGSTTAVDEVLLKGHYARKQLLCASRIISWSHRSRFKMARRLVEPYAGRKLLDYGCGDGTFVAFVSDVFPQAAGADPDANVMAECRRRFASLPGLAFLCMHDLCDSCYEGAFDVVTCMEVLEHCLEPVLPSVISDLQKLLAPGGAAIISVPIETGPSLAAKQIGRALAGWRGLADYGYREKYRPGEFLRMFFADERTTIERPVYRHETAAGTAFSIGHKGFNWRALGRKLAEHFTIERVLFTPLGWLGPYLNSQVWFVCKRP